MWESRESVYQIIKPPEAYKPRTPPPTAKELVRHLFFFARPICSASITSLLQFQLGNSCQEGEVNVVFVGAAGPESGENYSEIEVDDEAEVGGHLWRAGWTLQALR